MNGRGKPAVAEWVQLDPHAPAAAELKEPRRFRKGGKRRGDGGKGEGGSKPGEGGGRRG